MIKTVGKIFISLCLLSAYVFAGHVELRVTDRKRVLLKTIGAGERFKVEVSFEGARTSAVPTVKGLESLQIEGRQTQMRNAYGKESVTYAFHVRANKPGTLVLGPAEWEVEGSIKRSGSVTITVVEVSPEQASQHQNEQSSAVFARLNADKKQSVVGEQVCCSLRIYHNNPNFTLVNIADPILKNVVMKDIEGPFSGNEVVQGKSYSYLEWTWKAYAEKAGRCGIPAYSIDYAVPVNSDDDLFSSFVFLQRKEQKRIYSNPVEFLVDDIPNLEGSVGIPGAFQEFTARLQAHKALEGEGMVLTLEIMGAGDFERIGFPALQEMPDGLKWYESKSWVDAQGAISKKTFEYVVQGMKPGTWIIPPQHFVYFDTQRKKYTTLRTQPQTLAIERKRVETAQPLLQDQASQKTKKRDEIQKADERLSPLAEQGALHYAQPRKLSGMLILVLLCCMIGLYEFGYGGFRLARLYHYVPMRTSKLSQVKRLIKRAEKERDVQHVYQAILIFFAEQLSKPVAHIQEDDIDAFLVARGFSAEQREAWRQFFVQCAQCLYASPGAGDAALFKQAREWFTLFEKSV